MASLIPATTYTQEFLHADFEAYKNQFDWIKITDDLQTTQVPAVPVKLDTHLLEQIYTQAQISDQDFQPTVTGSLFRAWYRQPRSAGWYELTIKESQQPYQFGLAHDHTQSVARPQSRITKNSQLLEMSMQLFADLDIQLESIRIMKLEPQGWIRPHRDRTRVCYGLCYFWIPLHEFAPCLKIFPHGWLQHELGNMYLFNQNSYVHAAVNQSNQDRYVMIGRFDPAHVPGTLLNQYHDFKHKFRTIWKSTN